MSYKITDHYSHPIPKIIHYVWLGKGPLPEDAQEAIKSWDKYAPDYKIVRWDETNCPIDDNNFIRTVYAQKKYAWASDFCRFYALTQQGGFYFDTDVVLKKPFKKHINRNTSLILGYEINDSLAAGFIGITKNHPFAKMVLEHYKHTDRFKRAGPLVVTEYFKKEYPKIELNGKFYHSQAVTLYPANEMMFDLGGPENFAIHRYDASSTDMKKGTYYNIYYNVFLQQNGIPINYKNNKDYLIPIRDKLMYVLMTKQIGKVKKVTRDSITLRLGNGQDVTFERYGAK